MNTDVSLVSVLLRVTLFIVSLLAVGFFAGAETAFLAMDKWVIKSLSNEGNERARLLQALEQNSKNTLSALLVGTNIFTILVSVTALSIAYSFGFRGPVNVAIVSLVTTAFVFVFSELVPKTYAARVPTEAALSVSIPLGFAVRILSPVSYMMAVIPSLLVSILSRSKKDAFQKPESEVLAIFEMAEEDGYVKPEDKDVIDSVFNSKQKAVAEIMQPMKNVVTYKIGVTLWECIGLFDSHRYSRVPVVTGSGDKVAGVVYIKDAIREVVSNPENGSLPVTSVMRLPYLVQAGENILRVFSRLKRKKVHLAVVVQGKQPVGIITMDDLLEELVGDIPEEIQPHEAANTSAAYSRPGIYP